MEPEPSFELDVFFEPVACFEEDGVAWGATAREALAPADELREAVVRAETTADRALALRPLPVPPLFTESLKCSPPRSTRPRPCPIGFRLGLRRARNRIQLSCSSFPSFSFEAIHKGSKRDTASNRGNSSNGERYRNEYQESRRV